ncbi:hypothetical protein REC12_26130 [Desulfosporosinus sp. PR]|uniref:hypothetical protein n=1 Tax=Candidatus Desulfosporosinus nitrosoreducens TaxID=3401928 RepID=UPI0027FBB043|nr:hypothetical protein [Desulfosporosinus sp. PR]MDQ7097079.1 hypothetical protein [Desulfosporosinus sp. PR]
MRKKLRIAFVWTLISVLLQYGGYCILNNQVQKVISPPPASGIPLITTQLKANIPDIELSDVKISYAKDYLAYEENGTLKVFNLKKNKIVFQKAPPSASDKSLGVLTYQWLPDRNTLLYFYARKNPDPVSYVTVYPPKTTIQVPSSAYGSAPVPPKTEDPNQKILHEVSKTVTKEVTAAPHLERRYGNAQITELYSLDLPNSNENAAPDDRFNQTIDAFPARGKIKNLVVSTSTNLIYLTVKDASRELLLEIDVMKNVRTLSQSGETIDNMAASDRYGTLFLDSRESGARRIIALDSAKRPIISENSNDGILGIKDGKVYIGEIQNNQLIKIKTTSDLIHMRNNPSLATEWEGAIPFNNSSCAVIGTKGQVIVYDQQKAYIDTAGHLTEVQLHGDENYISDDGSELIRLTKQRTSTLVEVQPLQY